MLKKNKSRVFFNVNKCGWKHHITGGGWSWVSDIIYNNFHNDNAIIDFYTAYEYQVRESILNRPCVAIFHQVISGYIRSLENLVQHKSWNTNSKNILAAITMCQDQKNFLKRSGIEQVEFIYHPTVLNVLKWDIYCTHILDNHIRWIFSPQAGMV